MHKYLPSKKIVIAVIILLAIVFVMLVVSNYQNIKTPNTYNYIAPNVTIGGIDTDGDGLKDWEEALWGTDIKNKDTDGDGTIDGVEVSAGRNPLVAGPDDILSEKIIASIKNNDTPLTETDELTREFIRQYALLQQSGNVSEKDLSALAKKFADNALNTAEVYKYKYADIKTSPSTDESLYVYGNELYTILDTNTSDLNESEEDIFRKIFKENKIEEASKLKSVILEYKKAERGLILMDTPKIMSIYHIELINAVANIAFSLEEILEIESDPIKGFRGVIVYKNNIEKALNAIDNIVEVLIVQNIKFNKNDPGYQLLLLLI